MPQTKTRFKRENKITSLIHLRTVAILLVLQYLLDNLYVYLYPTVNPIRATLIGTSALLILFIPQLKKHLPLNSWLAFLPVYSSALLGALLVQAGTLVSKSILSGIIHALILVVTYLAIIGIKRYKKL